MSFKIYGSLFKQTLEEVRDRLQKAGKTFNPDTNYPNYTGFIEVATGDIDPLLEYLTGSTPDDNGKIRVPFSGWVRTAKTSGKQYISLQISPPQVKSQSAPAQQPVVSDDVPF